jgi:type IV pilus assembly protein PilO
MNKGNTSNSALAPLFDKIAELSKPQRMGLYIGVLGVLILLFGYFLLWPKFGTIDGLKTQLAQAQGELAKAKRNAAELNEWRSKMRKKETEYKTVMRELPEKEEIPSLLAGISQAGKDAGLEFLLFQPKPEVTKDFFAEIPVDINVSGSYHQVAVFFEKVSNLPRIVNIRNIKIAPQSQKNTGGLVTSCQAVTYKFIESAGKKNTHNRSRKRS